MNSDIEEAKYNIGKMPELELYNWLNHIDNNTPTEARLDIRKHISSRIMSFETKIPKKGCKQPSVQPAWSDCSDGDRI